MAQSIWCRIPQEEVEELQKLVGNISEDIVLIQVSCIERDLKHSND
jgi:hypothetical protein